MSDRVRDQRARKSESYNISQPYENEMSNIGMSVSRSCVECRLIQNINLIHIFVPSIMYKNNLE